MSEPDSAKPEKRRPAKPDPKPRTPKKATAPKAAKAAKATEVAGGVNGGGAGAPNTGRGRRKTREGIVVSNKMSKTVVVAIDRRIQHPLYGKTVTRSRRFKAHDEIGCDEGDRVLIMETRPLSREKRWRVVTILEKVK